MKHNVFYIVIFLIALSCQQKITHNENSKGIVDSLMVKQHSNHYKKKVDSLIDSNKTTCIISCASKYSHQVEKDLKGNKLQTITYFYPKLGFSEARIIVYYNANQKIYSLIEYRTDLRKPAIFIQKRYFDKDVQIIEQLNGHKKLLPSSVNEFIDKSF
ncbi:protein of unknown function [Tenacibaculum sp. 190130A14a]|uniref:Lipoprotein n=1 Tax=Tenacibaculum polynesiense TaxID=3137857 RepID=A0ABM9PD53_9FLAO